MEHHQGVQKRQKRILANNKSPWLIATELDECLAGYPFLFALQISLERYTYPHGHLTMKFT